MNFIRQQLEKFYRVLWDEHDKSAIPDVLAQGCLGTFLGYSVYIKAY